MNLLRLLRLRLGGTLAMIPGGAFATGEVTSAQLAEIPCDVTREGEERRLTHVGGDDPEDSRKVRCEKTGGAWGWTEVGGAALLSLPFATLSVTDGVSAPDVVTGRALIYVDTADGDLKVKFADGTVKTLATDS